MLHEVFSCGSRDAKLRKVKVEGQKKIAILGARVGKLPKKHRVKLKILDFFFA